MQLRALWAYPLVKVLARALDRGHAVELMRAGADFQIRETLESSYALAGAALSALGEAEDEVGRLLHEAKHADEERLQNEFLDRDMKVGDYLIGNLR